MPAKITKLHADDPPEFVDARLFDDNEEVERDMRRAGRAAPLYDRPSLGWLLLGVLVVSVPWFLGVYYIASLVYRAIGGAV